MKFNKIFSVLACAALLSGTFACTDKVEPTPSPVAGNEEVYFAYTTSPDITIPLNATQISVTVNRVDATEESTVGLTSSVSYVDDTDEENPVNVPVTDVFTIPTSITFPKDVKEITVEIGVDFEKVVIDRDYYIDLALDAAHTGSYGLSQRIFKATYLPWTDWTLVSESDPGTYTLSILANGYYQSGVYTRQSLTNENLVQYMMPMPTENLGLPEGTRMIVNMDKTKKVDIDGTECTYVWMDYYIDPGMSNSNGTLCYTTTWSWLRWWAGPTFADKTDAELYQIIEANGFKPSYFDPVKGCFFLNMMLFYIDNPGYLAGEYLETMQLPGDFHDYFFSFNLAGNTVAMDDTEYALVQVLSSDDIDHFSCTVLPGELTAAQVTAAQDELAADEDAEQIFDHSYTINYPFTEDGLYTVVVVGFDKNNNVVCRASKTYTFESIRVTNEWNRVGTADYTDGIFVGLLLNAKGLVTWSVPLDQHKEYANVYRLVNPYSTWPLLDEIGWDLVEGRHYITLDARDASGVLMPLSDTGLFIDEKIDQEGHIIGDALVMSKGWYAIQSGQVTAAQAKRMGMLGKFEYDEDIDCDVITFPTAGLYLVTEDSYILTTNCDPNAPKDAPVTYGNGCFAVEIPRDVQSVRKIGRKMNIPSVHALKKMVSEKTAAGKFNPGSISLSKEERTNSFRSIK